MQSLGFDASNTTSDGDLVSTFVKDFDDLNEKIFNNGLHRIVLGSLKQLIYEYDSNYMYMRYNFTLVISSIIFL